MRKVEVVLVSLLLPLTLAVGGCNENTHGVVETPVEGGKAIAVYDKKLPVWWDGMPFAVWYDQAKRVHPLDAETYYQLLARRHMKVTGANEHEATKAVMFEDMNEATRYAMMGKYGNPVFPTSTWERKSLVWECTAAEFPGKMTPADIPCDSYKN